jgi:hypothetical protein
MDSHTNVHAHRQVVPNWHTPLAQVFIFVTLIVVLILSGCVGLTSAGKPAANTPSGTITASATSLTFGNVAAGSSSSQTLTLTNTGTVAFTISQATVVCEIASLQAFLRIFARAVLP